MAESWADVANPADVPPVAGAFSASDRGETAIEATARGVEEALGVGDGEAETVADGVAVGEPEAAGVPALPGVGEVPTLLLAVAVLRPCGLWVITNGRFPELSLQPMIASDRVATTAGYRRWVKE